MGKKLTPWFSGHIKPARKGLYQTMNRLTNSTGYQHWDGTVWGCFGDGKLSALRYANLASNYQDKAWRGLSSNPKDTK